MVTNESSMATRDCTRSRKSVASRAAATAAPAVAALAATCPASSRRTRRYRIATLRVPATAEVMRQPNSS